MPGHKSGRPPHTCRKARLSPAHVPPFSLSQAEPGFAPTVQRKLSSEGMLALGGFATCVVTTLELAGDVELW